MRSIAGYVRRHHIGLLALFVALSGTAYAVQNAPKDSVVSKSIKDGQVKPKDAKLTKTVTYPDLVSLDPFSIDVLEPSLKVQVPKSGLVSAFAESQVKKVSGPAGEICVVSLQVEEGGVFDGLMIDTSSGSTFGNRRTSPGTSGAGVLDQSDGGSITYRLPPGKTDFAVSYGSGSGTDCQFQNTELSVTSLP